MTLRKFITDVLTIVGGTAAAQLIVIAASPILSRLYSPENFGVFGIFLSLSAIISMVSTGRYELAILLPKNDEDGYAVLLLCCLLAGTFSLFLFLAVLLVRPEAWWYFVPLAVFFTACVNSLSYWRNRRAEYRRIAAARVSSSAFTTAISVCLGLSGMGSVGLIVGLIIGSAVSAGLLLRHPPRFSDPDIRGVAKRYIKFPQILVAAHLINALSQRLPLLLLAPMFGFAVAGFYMLAHRVITLPTQLLSTSIGEVFRRKASETYREKGNCRSIYVSTLAALTLLAIPVFLSLFWIAPHLFVILFGLEWEAAGEMVRILAPMLAIQFVASPLSSMFMIAERQGMDIIWQVALLSAVAGSFGIGYLTGSEFITLACFSGSYTVMYLVNLAITYRFASGGDHVKV